MNTSLLTKAASLLIMVFMPVILMLGAVRLVLAPWYVEVEYHMPGFPADMYGFTQADRLKYSHIALDYLLNDAGIDFLGDLHFENGGMAPMQSCQFIEEYDGDCTRMYNNRELSHMVDVKIVLGQVLNVLYAALVFLALVGVWAWRTGWLGDYLQAAGRGGWLTVGLIVVILAFVVIAFYPFFTFFHNLFFAEGTWTFYWSDTLIRLFPGRFWQDTFIWVGGFAAVIGLVLGLKFAPFKK